MKRNTEISGPLEVDRVFFYIHSTTSQLERVRSKTESRELGHPFMSYTTINTVRHCRRTLSISLSLPLSLAPYSMSVISSSPRSLRHHHRGYKHRTAERSKLFPSHPRSAFCSDAFNSPDSGAGSLEALNPTARARAKSPE